ncbi:unnamed protein product [Brachionus calyciflorus]|uniref:Uncharacterized protein n=1 Tax=Brachionus calyciflorus TaxID=104777 RepID=A0A813V8H7_9BILA|nr:unnamed protein product [Brachionus calyciflorus]
MGSNDELKLEELLDWGRTKEVASYQIKDIKTNLGTQFTVNKIYHGNHTGQFRRCYSCGLKFPYLKNVLSIENVTNAVGDNRLPRAEVMVNKNFISFMIDTGSPVNILDESSFDKLKEHVKLREYVKKIFPYKSINPLPMLGEFETEITWNVIVSRTCFRVVKGEADIIHRPGLSNIADDMSRHPVPEEKSADEWLSEEFVNFVVNNSMPKSITREQGVNETE